MKYLIPPHLQLIKAGIFCLLLFGCFNTKETANSTTDNKQPAVSNDDNCKDVPKLNWQEEVRGYSSEKKLEFATAMKLAAEADVKLSKDANAGAKIEGSLSSELAKLVNNSVLQSSKVSSDFWEQELTFRQTICFMSTQLSSIADTSLKRKYHELMMAFMQQRIDYTFQQKKRPGISQ